MLVANSRGAINWLVVYRIWAAPFEMSFSRLRQTMLPSPRDKSKSEPMGGIQSYVECFLQIPIKHTQPNSRLVARMHTQQNRSFRADD